MKITLVLSLASSLLMSGCCKQVHFTPERPSVVRGWQKFDDHGMAVIGEFLLKKGQSVDNGKFGVELVRTIAPQKCYELSAENILIPHAVLRFYELPSKRTLIEIDASRHTNHRLMDFNFPVDKYDVDSVLIDEINTKEEWVWFELLK